MRILLATAAALALCACAETETDSTATDEIAAEEESPGMADAGEAAEAPTQDSDDLTDAAADATPEPEEAPEKADPWQQVTIAGFECGDNCYLIYTRAGGSEEESALCEARECEPWFEMQEMPPRFVGRRIGVQFGTGQQVDGSGNVMSDDFPSITRIRM